MSERNGTVAASDPGTRPIVVGTGATGPADAAGPVDAAGPTESTGPAEATGRTSTTGRPSGTGATAATAASAATAAAPPSDAQPVTAAPAPAASARPAPDAGADRGTAPGVQPTAPVSTRPRPRLPRRGPLTVMGPWAPVAGGLLGLLLGLVVVALLAGVAESFEDRLALAFTVLGLGMVGAAGTLLADEVRMLRQHARAAAVRPQWVESTASLLNGLTPARLLLGCSAFVLFLAAFVSR